MANVTLVAAPHAAARAALGCLLVAWATGAPVAQDRAASPYARLRTAALEHCHTIAPDAAQTGMIFNPPGHRSVYLRSACVQEAAITFRDPSLCADVRERRSLFFSSWAYSPERCEELVRAAVTEDHERLGAIAARHRSQPTRLRDFSVTPNGNGRDFDIVPSFEAGAPATYLLRFEILDDTGLLPPALIHSSSYYVDRTTVLRIFVRLSDIRSQLPGFETGVARQVRATMELDVGHGSTAGWWSEAFVEQVYPKRDRSQTLEKTIQF